MSTKAKLFGVLLIAVAAAIGGGIYGASEFLATQSESAAAACDEHGIQSCPFCDPSLLSSMGFCKEHGVPEAICSRCRSDLEPAFRTLNDWCGGHGVPESQCELCNPGTLEKYRQYAPEEDAVLALTPEIEIARDDSPRVRREPSVICATERSVIRFAGPMVAERAGLETADVSRAPLRKMLSAPAELGYDATRHALLASRAPGNVVEVRKQLGERVEAGDVLIVVDSAAFGTAKSELHQAAARVELWKKNHAREKQLLEKSLSTEMDVLEAETQLTESRIAVAAAEQKLSNLGLDAARIAALREQRDTSTRLELVSPFAGLVVELRAVIGQLADPSIALISVADTSRIWVVADVEQGDIASVRPGQALLLTLDGVPGETFAGRVTWISTQVDPRTRTVKVRAELGNDRGQLRAGMFGRVRIVTRDGEPTLFVPKSAVQWEGCCNVAFVQRSSTEFVPRKLRLGYDTGEHYEVLAGLAAGDRVVTLGSFLLKTELKKGSIGAGCCEVDYLGK